MSVAAPRAALRPTAKPRPRLVLQQHPRITSRHASTTSEAANAAAQTTTKAKDSTANAASKASQGLSRVAGSAGSVLSRAGPAIGGALGRVGGRTGRVIGFGQSLIPPTVYYAKVAAELSKMVFHGQRMMPPTTAQFQAYFQPLLHTLRNPSSLFASNPGLLQNPQQYLNRVRNMSTGQMLTYGVVAAEVYGFYKVGEILGRMKIVGYRYSGPSAHGEGH